MNRPVLAPPRPRTRAFSLIELIVVIAIIAILAAILFPVFAQAREKARAASCLSNQKQISYAVQMYAQDYDEVLPAVEHSGHKGWIDQIQPYSRSEQIRRCTSDTSFNVPGRRTSYAVNNSLDGVPLSRVNAPASTIYAAEQADGRAGDHYHPASWGGADNFGWLAGKPTEVAWRRHSEGANYAFLDSHAKWYRFEGTFSLPAVNLHDPDR
jgi:prepilin-type N-terminal cleavage/methylation domain-containing protein/prepilin-type processing-associated H-X9-DG protein